jgi:hypothetical protein
MRRAVIVGVLATSFVACASAEPKTKATSTPTAITSVATTDGAATKSTPTPAPAPASSAATTEVSAKTTIASLVASTTAPPGTEFPADVEAYDGAWPPPLDAPCAQPSPAALATARAHFVGGVKAFDDADYFRAIIEFQQSYRLACNAHKVLYDVARTQEQLGRTADAIASYELFLQRAQPDPTRAAEVAAKIDALKKKLTAKKP